MKRGKNLSQFETKIIGNATGGQNIGYKPFVKDRQFNPGFFPSVNEAKTQPGPAVIFNVFSSY